MIIKIATRKSPLALVQAEMVRNKLLAAFPGVTCELVAMSTSGDDNADRVLAEIGGKGLFTKELEEGLLSGKFDIAVHSLKDMETILPQGLMLAAVLEREDPRDALIAKDNKKLADLGKVRFGTSAMRRAAQLKIISPDIEIVNIRGNVATRLQKVVNGEVDATMLAFAALKRLNLQDQASEVLSSEYFIPAVGQGIIAIECRENNTQMRDMLAQINHAESFIAATAERSLLAVLDGSCRTPIAGYAEINGNNLRLNSLIAKPDGSFYTKAERSGNIADAVKIGQEVAAELLANGGRDCL